MATAIGNMLSDKIPPDRTKTSKNKLNNILKSGVDYSNFINGVDRVNDIKFIVSHFYRGYILFLYQESKNIPVMNKNFFRIAMKVITKHTNRGSKIGNERNQELFEQMTNYYDNHFVKNITNYTKIDGKLLGFCLDELSIEMAIAHKNNITINFMKYFFQTVKSMMTSVINFLIDQKKITVESVKKTIKTIRDDIINNKKTTDYNFHGWISILRRTCFPDDKFTDISGLQKDIKTNPHKYLPNMLKMNELLEKNNRKTFQPLCLGNNIKNKYVTFTSSAIANLLIKKNKYDTLKNINKRKEQLWKNLFNINVKGYNKYRYNHQISTDGYSVSINLIRKDEYEKHQSFLRNRANASKLSKKEGSMTKEKETMIAKNNRLKELKKIQDREKLSKSGKEDFKKATVEDQKKIIIKIKLSKEWVYIKDAIKDPLILKELSESFDKGKIVVGDPGKRTIMQLRSSNGKDFAYNNRRRVNQNKRLKSQRLILNRKKKAICKNGKTVMETEQLLQGKKSKTMDHALFLEFINEKLKVRELILNNDEYHAYLLKQRWHSFLNNERHENLLREEIKKRFGKDAIYIIGDWNESSSSPLKFMSTPGIGMRRLMRSIGPVFLIDEFRTSMYRQDNKEKLKNLLLDFNNHKREIHSVLTYQMSNRRLGCINRDKNAVKNMLQIVDSLIKTGNRPDIFNRTKVRNQKSKKITKNSDRLSNASHALKKGTCTGYVNKTWINVKNIANIYKKICVRQQNLTKQKFSKVNHGLN